MIPTKAGQVVRLHTPLEDEDPYQTYVVLEIYNGPEWPRAQIIPLYTGLAFPPVNIVRPNELEVTMISTTDLIGGYYAIINEDGSVKSGHLISVEQKEIIPEFKVGPFGIETNLKVTIEGAMGKIFKGRLLVTKKIQ